MLNHYVTRDLRLVHLPDGFPSVVRVLFPRGKSCPAYRLNERMMAYINLVEDLQDAREFQRRANESWTTDDEMKTDAICQRLQAVYGAIAQIPSWDTQKVKDAFQAIRRVFVANGNKLPDLPSSSEEPIRLDSDGRSLLESDEGGIPEEIASW